MDEPSTLCTAMMRLGSRMVAVFDHHMAPLGLTQAQFRLLVAVCQQPGIAPSELAGQLLVDRATVSLVTSRMVQAGLLERRPGANRRTHALHLTEAGQAVLETAAPRATALAHEAVAGLQPHDQEQLTRLLQQLERRVRAL